MKITSNKIHQLKHKENQTRPYGLNPSFLPLVGLSLAVPLPKKGTLHKPSSGSVESTHQSHDLGGCTYQSSDPEGCTYQSSDPEGCTYQSSDPDGCTYQSSDPEGCTYQSSDPEGYTYQLKEDGSGLVSLKLGQPQATGFRALDGSGVSKTTHRGAMNDCFVER
ncbi:NBS-LRR type resistance protein [Cucumis melo var. makuwa]|uniref:NBS-LRR type resistance protein n=1 Tax=Cucumis melo var. makuwa TaxID=1194695 RepID=A0A5A7V164_CUCMM|nr:NBS-LRR type resistance protein [Cucumis melo var. makuwa]TYK21524.1 NBS-LRR type resistance protein [Cucumis melo var. makuwa]